MKLEFACCPTIICKWKLQDKFPPLDIASGWLPEYIVIAIIFIIIVIIVVLFGIKVQIAHYRQLPVFGLIITLIVSHQWFHGSYLCLNSSSKYDTNFI
jgi:hypothetical protein